MASSAEHVYRINRLVGDVIARPNAKVNLAPTRISVPREEGSAFGSRAEGVSTD